MGRPLAWPYGLAEEIAGTTDRKYLGYPKKSARSKKPKAFIYRERKGIFFEGAEFLLRKIAYDANSDPSASAIFVLNFAAVRGGIWSAEIGVSILNTHRQV